MSVAWTEEQLQVIGHRGSNLLVSAAAGSGKTAVLVERIIRMVTDAAEPVDIDQLLVMTFTNAAAAEMRERISAAIEKKLEEGPGDKHLQMQASLVHHAQITTIDSFCLGLIRTYFNRLDLDPSFRIGDEGELLLLRQDVMQELLEDYYTNGGERFERFVDTYAIGKSDAGIGDYILKVWTFAQSNPYPFQWLCGCREELEAADGVWEDLSWVRFIVQDLRQQATELAGQLQDALEICQESERLDAYAPMLAHDVAQLCRIRDADGLDGIHSALSGFVWDALARIRAKDVDPDKKAYVMNCRDRAKKAVKKMQELYAYADLGQMRRDMRAANGPVLELLELAEQFMLRYQEKKRERNLADFNDLEHEALKVLIEQDADGLTKMEQGRYVYTDVADELSRQYAEVLVDEYQDSNLVQEALIHAVSRERFGEPNIFMVGDVKQSIYRFRLARPELFLEKYHSYGTAADGPGILGRRIELHQNFRSRSQVLDGINEVFYQIMTENLGNIRYTEDTALHAGAVFAPYPEEGDGEAGKGMAAGAAGYPELFVVDTGKGAFDGLDDEAADYTAKEIEAKLIAARIRELTDPGQGLKIWDKGLGESGGYRTARHRDIVILLRSTAGWAETLLSVLMNEGIPAYAESRMGYFNTVEVETVLSFLSIIDNPMQDIPFAAVLRSPIVGVTDEELAIVMSEYRKCPRKGQDRGIYAAFWLYLHGGEGGEGQESRLSESPGLRERLLSFADMLGQFRQESIYLPIHELIYRVYERTGYYRYVSAMPAGTVRQANLDMLVEKAAAYEKTSYKGLFHFIRYIRNLKKYNTDFGEASTLGEEDDTVRIMSIHKSKGLEFPVVFLAGMGKKFNKQDVYSRILIDPELGIGADYLNLECRVKTSTLKKNVLRRKMDLDSLGEELRVLYVAMTRAKEKLVMTGTDRHLEKAMERYAEGRVPLVEGQIPYTVLSTASSYLDWILMGMGCPRNRIQVQVVPMEEIVGGEMGRQIGRRRSKELLAQMDMDKVYDESTRQMLEKYLSYQYPYQADIGLHTKMSVSELKKQGQMIDETESVCLVSVGPEGTGTEETGTKMPMSPGRGYGATRGTAYHRALELLPFARLHSEEEIGICLDRLAEEKRYSAESRKYIDTGVIWRFLQSSIGQRMCAAEKSGCLHKEQQFVMGIPAREMGDYDTDELVVVQGIIDAFFEEEGGLVLVDYKSDRVHSPQVLVDHYKTQLAYYGRALSQMTGKPVKERIIYSLMLQQEICC